MAEKKKVFKLETNQGSYALVAISSAESLHKIGWHINQILGINLSNVSPIQLIVNNISIEFPVLKDDGSLPETIFTLVKSKQEKGVLIKTLPNIDYFLKIYGTITEKSILEYLKKLKSITAINAVVKVDHLTVKHFRVFDEV